MNSKRTMGRPWDRVDPTGPQYRVSEVQRLLGISRGSVYNLIKKGQLPPLIKIGERASAMPKAWLDACIRDCANANNPSVQSPDPMSEV